MQNSLLHEMLGQMKHSPHPHALHMFCHIHTCTQVHLASQEMPAACVHIFSQEPGATQEMPAACVHAFSQVPGATQETPAAKAELEAAYHNLAHTHSDAMATCCRMQGGTFAMSSLPYMSKLESITSSAVRAAEKSRASLILVFTHTSRAAQLVAKYRPPMPILTLVVPRLMRWVGPDQQWNTIIFACCSFLLIWCEPMRCKDTSESAM
eukprot:1151964-Pelagomonas_calceolata.AAC.11